MIRLKKSLGQHLLISSGVLAEIAKKAEIQKDDYLLEIGPGLGHLTKEILKYPFQKLYLLEIDREMLEALKKEIKDERVIFLEGDATTFDYTKLNVKELKVLGNLPYNVASLIVENILYHYYIIPFALFLVQKEVAEKWISGTSWLSLFIQTFYDITYLMSVPPKFFKPPPKVDSGLISLKKNVKAKIHNLISYKKFLTQLFHQKRKMLRKKISEEFLERAGLTGKERIEELSFKEILSLYQIWLALHEK
ncbi:MAG: 16S rRNA (adenine(1518)-N(6)/adenine(1519)-N(6))-dimethyltransferase RsmA [Caldimicrobium sp.]